MKKYIKNRLIHALIFGENYCINKFNMDYEINTHKICKTCGEKKQMDGSHSFSKSWLPKNTQSLWYIDYDKNIKRLYKEINIAREIVRKERIFSHKELNIIDNMFYNVYKKTKAISASKVFSLYFAQCEKCENRYNLKDTIEENFIEKKKEYGFSLLRYELYYQYKYNLIIKNIEYNKEKLQNNIKRINYVIKLISDKNYNFLLEKMKDELFAIKKSIKKSKFEEKEKHSFHLYKKRNSFNAEDYYQYQKSVLIEIEKMFLSNFKFLKKNFFVKKLEKKKIKYEKNIKKMNQFLLEYKKSDTIFPYNIDKAIELYQSSYSNIEIKDNNILKKFNIFGFSKIDLENIGLLFDKFLIDVDDKMYYQNKAIYFFITPSKNIDYTRHITIFVPNEFKEKFDILINKINDFYDGSNINGETLFFILGLLKNDFLTIYSTEKEILDKMIEIKKFIPDEYSKMNEGIDITEQKMIDFYKKVEDLIK